MKVKFQIFFIVVSILIISSGCKSNGKEKGTDKSESTADAIVPKDGFSPIGFKQSFDPEKEAKLIKALGTTNFKKVNDIILTPQLLENWQASAIKAMDERKALEGNKTYASWASNTWVVDAIFKDVFSDPELAAGRWIEFKEDFTYVYGRYDKVSGKGIYHYSPEDEVVILLDDDKDVKPLEFINSWDNGFTVIGGTDTYGDNGLMIKLINKPNRPTSPNN